MLAFFLLSHQHPACHLVGLGGVLSTVLLVYLVALSSDIILDAEQVSTSSPLAALLADSTGLDAGGPQVRGHDTIKQIQVWSSSAFSNVLTK